jgi:hypothetical protein
METESCEDTGLMELSRENSKDNDTPSRPKKSRDMPHPHIDIEGVTGSIPVASTISFNNLAM